MVACASLGAGASRSSQSGRQEVVAVLQRQASSPRRSFRGVLGWEVEQFAEALALRSWRAVQGVWRVPVWGRGHLKRELHKELMRNFMEPCVVYGSPFTKLGREWAELEVPLERPCVLVLSSLRTTVRPTTRGAWIGRNYSCISRRNCCKTSIPGHTGLGFKKATFAHFL